MKLQENSARVIVLFFKEPWKFIFAALIAMAVSFFSLGILAPAMWLGMGEIFKKFRNGGEISNSDLFMHLDKAVMLAVEGFLIVVSVGIGYILIVPGVIMGALFVYALYFMAYKGTGIIDSIKLSSFTVNKNDLMAHIVVTLVIGLILSAGFSTVIGAVIAYPLCAGFMAFMFEDVKDV